MYRIVGDFVIVFQLIPLSSIYQKTYLLSSSLRSPSSFQSGRPLVLSLIVPLFIDPWLSSSRSLALSSTHPSFTHLSVYHRNNGFNSPTIWFQSGRQKEETSHDSSIKEVTVEIEESQRLVEIPGSNILRPVPLFPKISQANEETDDTCLEDPDNPQHSFIDCCYARRLVAINKRNKARFDVVNAQNVVLLAQNDALNERVFKGVENEMNSHCENYEITNLLQRRNKHYLEARSLIKKQWGVIFAFAVISIVVVIGYVFKH